MTEELQFICGLTLFFILGCFYIYFHPKNQQDNEPQNTSKNQTQNINSIDALNNLLQQGIISQQEYNKMVVKVMNKN